jgi:hypothetical protein
MAFAMSGCSISQLQSKEDYVSSKEATMPLKQSEAKSVLLVKKAEAYPILKENDPYQKAVVDMGKVLRTKITSYKDSRGNLIASHDIYHWAVKPDFVTTNTLPKKRPASFAPKLKVNMHKEGIVNLESLADTQTSVSTQESADDALIEEFVTSHQGGLE